MLLSVYPSYHSLFLNFEKQKKHEKGGEWSLALTIHTTTMLLCCTHLNTLSSHFAFSAAAMAWLAAEKVKNNVTETRRDRQAASLDPSLSLSSHLAS